MPHDEVCCDLRQAAAELPFSSYIALEWTSGGAGTLSLCVHVPRRESGWSRFHPRIVEACLRDGAPCAASVQDIFFEFDAPFRTPPAVFIGIREDVPARGAAARLLASLVAPSGRIPEDLLPSVCHVAAMPARSPDLLRLNVTGRGIVEIPALRDLAASLAGFTNHCVGSVDVVRGRRTDCVGLECYVRDWPRFLEECRRRGWCSDADVKRWLSWPGETDGPADSELPEYAVWMRRLSGGRSTVRRALHHAKMIVEPGRSVQMKIYPAARQVWR